DVAATVDAGTLAVPHRKHAVVFRARKEIQLLRAPDGGGGEVFVDAGLEFDVVRGKVLLCAPERLIEPAERRTAVTGDVAGSVQARGEIALALQHRQSHERLRAGEEHAPGIQRVLVVQGNPGERCGVERGVHGRSQYGSGPKDSARYSSHTRVSEGRVRRHG